MLLYNFLNLFIPLQGGSSTEIEQNYVCLKAKEVASKTNYNFTTCIDNSCVIQLRLSQCQDLMSQNPTISSLYAHFIANCFPISAKEV